MDLTDEQWAVLEPLLPKPRRRPDGRGRRWRDPRDVLNGILWILKTGAPWQDLPRRYPPYQTCHRRYQAWVRAGVLERVLYTMAEDCRDRGHLDLSECFLDGTFVIAKKGAQGWVQPSGARYEDHGHGRRRWSSSRRPRGSASPAEVTLVEPTLASCFPAALPQRLIGDKAYDSDTLDAELAAWGIELIAPHRANRVRSATQDGRPLRRYHRRWKMERLMAWLQNYRRVLVRWEHHLENFLGFVQLACVLILLRRGRYDAGA